MSVLLRELDASGRVLRGLARRRLPAAAAGGGRPPSRLGLALPWLSLAPDALGAARVEPDPGPGPWPGTTGEIDYVYLIPCKGELGNNTHTPALYRL